MNDNIKKFMSISIWFTVFLFLIRCVLSWADIKSLLETSNMLELCYNFYGFIGEAIGVSAIGMAIFNKVAWKWLWLRWMHDVPILAPKYNGKLKSDFDGTEYSGDLIVNQTFLSVSIQFKTNESSSSSVTATFSNINSVSYLIYTYQNEPRAEIQDRSAMHYGTAMLDVSNPMKLEGNYYTGRKTRGSMKFEAVREESR